MVSQVRQLQVIGHVPPKLLLSKVRHACVCMHALAFEGLVDVRVPCVTTSLQAL